MIAIDKVSAHLEAAAGDPYEAARVSRFMADDCPKISPSERWKLDAFSVTPEEEQHRELQALFKAARRDGVGVDHYVRAGSYVQLSRRRDWRSEFEDIEKHRGEPLSERDKEFMRSILPSYLPMMSDTTNEIEDHEDVIAHAGGRMLIHGLGLGCIVAALHVMPEVEHIDVVEIDQEVINLTGLYYATLPKVSLVQADAMTHKWPKGAHWDYVWHDIWERISSLNLDPNEAEYGISYDRLFDLFEDRADRQGAWAYDKALTMHAVELRQEAHADALVERWPGLNQREREDILIESKFRGPLSIDGLTPAAFRDMLKAGEGKGGMEGWHQMMEQVARAAQKEISQTDALMILGYLSLDDAV